MPILMVLAILIVGAIHYTTENYGKHPAYTPEEVENLARLTTGKSRREVREILKTFDRRK